MFAVTKPKDAASVIIVRERRTGEDFPMEVLMVRRHRKANFVPNVYVFPGGRVDEMDYHPHMLNYLQGVSLEEAAGQFGDVKPPEKALGIYVAAIRETFEEVGILIAYEEDGKLLSYRGRDRKRRYAQLRASLIEGRLSFLDLLEKERLKLAADRLIYFSHWITPELSPIRFNVRFFLAEAPSDQRGSHNKHELADLKWVSPPRALALYEKGEFDMVLPTIMNLAELSQYKSVSHAKETARRKKVLTVLSEIKLFNGVYFEVVPEREEFEDLRRLWPHLVSRPV
ncbi:MAG: NUDIX hydrolase [Syntrophales bacterium]|nr:NUDIX hydrolase [Syntrophales bacterium]